MPPDSPSARASSVAREVADGLVGYRAEAAVLVSSRACGDSMGEEWGRMQSAALGLADESFEETCRAALGLYGLAANEVHHLFDGRQGRVVRHARELGGLANG